jgi:fumarate hydratase class I
MKPIQQEDFIQSVADAFQFISYYHPKDYIDHLWEAYQNEQSPAAKDAMAQILINSRMAAEGHRPICQDTGIAIAFIKVGMDVRWDTKLSLEQLVNEGRAPRVHRQGQSAPRLHALRSGRQAREHRRQHARRSLTWSSSGDKVEVIVAAEAAARRTSRSSRCCCRATRSSTGCSRWCPPWARTGARPGMLSLGIGGSPEEGRC